MTGLELQRVTAGYGRRQVLRGITASLDSGMVGLLGPNGSGKSTLIKVLARVLRHRGEVSYAGLRGQQLRDATGYVPQDIPGDVALTALEAVLVAARRGIAWRTSRSDLAMALAALEEVGVDALADRWLGELSGGQRQLVGVAQMLARSPRLMLLDEPTSALDLHHQLGVLDVVRRRASVQGRCAVVALHDVNLAARYCDRLVVLDGGRLVACGTPREVLTVERLRATWRVEADLHEAGGQTLVAARQPVR